MGTKPADFRALTVDPPFLRSRGDRMGTSGHGQARPHARERRGVELEQTLPREGVGRHRHSTRIVFADGTIEGTYLGQTTATVLDNHLSAIAP